MTDYDEAGALAWVASLVDEPVAAHRRLPGATSSTLLHCTTRGGRAIVARLHTNPAFFAEVPDRLQHEAVALSAAARLDLPTPGYLGRDDGGACGVPALLMEHLGGSVAVRLCDAALETMAGALRQIHALPVPELAWRYASFTGPDQVAVPAWAGDRALWARAIDVYRAGPPEAPEVFLHRDFHPTNLLWQGAALSGVVDWIYACRGPAGADVAHCRVNLALMAGTDAVATFGRSYGATLHPYWDVNAIFGTLPDPGFYEPWATFGLARIPLAERRRRLEAYLKLALMV